VFKHTLMHSDVMKNQSCVMAQVHFVRIHVKRSYACFST